MRRVVFPLPRKPVRIVTGTLFFTVVMFSAPCVFLFREPRPRRHCFLFLVALMLRK